MSGIAVILPVLCKLEIVQDMLTGTHVYPWGNGSGMEGQILCDTVLNYEPQTVQFRNGSLRSPE
jgi:hypothetical protein